MSKLYEMNHLNEARRRMEQAIREGSEFDVVFADLGFEGELVRIMARYTAVSFLGALFDEMDVDCTEGEIEKAAYCFDASQAWIEGFLVGLLLSPVDCGEIRFPTFLSAVLGGRRLKRTVPVELRELGVDARDATEAAATVGAMASQMSADMPHIATNEWEALYARTWLDGLIVARLARTLSESPDGEEAAAT